MLPIGGVKEKLLAAHRIGVTTIILPRENEKDLADVPKNVLEALTVELVDAHRRGAEDRPRAARPRRSRRTRRSRPAGDLGLQDGMTH